MKKSAFITAACVLLLAQPVDKGTWELVVNERYVLAYPELPQKWETYLRKEVKKSGKRSEMLRLLPQHKVYRDDLELIERRKAQENQRRTEFLQGEKPVDCYWYEQRWNCYGAVDNLGKKQDKRGRDRGKKLKRNRTLDE